MTFKELDYVQTLDGSIKGVITSILNGWYEVEYVNESGATFTKKFRAKQLNLWNPYREMPKIQKLYVYDVHIELQDNTVLRATLSQKSASAASEFVGRALNSADKVVTVGERVFLFYLKKDQRED